LVPLVKLPTAAAGETDQVYTTPVILVTLNVTCSLGQALEGPVMADKEGGAPFVMVRFLGILVAHGLEAVTDKTPDATKALVNTA
jgi:hypothetical protein